ncbi:MAG TPA: hypothetical protein VG892_09230, partial [Terriglobales bacterium]|nr:hypothetical protein [Terriglobales bacterium]
MVILVFVQKYLTDLQERNGAPNMQAIDMNRHNSHRFTSSFLHADFIRQLAVRFRGHARYLLLCAGILTLLAQGSAFAQTRELTVAVLVNSQNTTGYNTSTATPGEFQRYAERYLEHLQIPYDIFDVSTSSPPLNLGSRQLIISGHSGLALPADWRIAIVNAVNGGTGFVNLDSSSGIGSESHMTAIFGSNGSTVGSPATQITIP